MPYRRTPLVSGQYYHVICRSVGSCRIFNSIRDKRRLTGLIDFYRFGTLPLRFSFYDRLTREERDKWWQEIIKNYSPVVKIAAFCLMGNHLHFLLKQEGDNGISVFVRNVLNSYGHYFNVKYERIGPLFQPMFKAVIIETNEQLMHVSRYIHLNPVSACMIEAKNIKEYEWSSYADYLGG